MGGSYFFSLAVFSWPGLVQSSILQNHLSLAVDGFPLRKKTKGKALFFPLSWHLVGGRIKEGCLWSECSCDGNKFTTPHQIIRYCSIVP